MQSENKRIIKNSFFLYFRMILVMGVTLFTSRIVLEQLGIDDYGIYSVVGGVIILFTFISQAMSTSTQRFITFEIGKNDGNVSKIFGICLTVHLIMMGIVLIGGETVGLWFLNNKMNFPLNSYSSVNWVYQMTILTCLISIFQFPYNALVLAYEEMNFYAYSSIVEVFLKLGIAYVLMITNSNKLVIYSILLAIVSVIILVWHVIYCRVKFKKIQIKCIYDKSTIIEISKFSGWAIFGSMANMGFQQGISIIINLFYGVTVNAAVGIANQVNSAVNRFVVSFQQAINPQLIKSEANQSKERQIRLIETSSKFSFLIMLLIATPLIINLNYIVNVWLTEVPPLTIIISQLIIIGALIETLSGPLWVTIFATGKIKYYQISISLILLLNLPLSYYLGKIGYSAPSFFIIRIILFIVALITRLFFLRVLIGLNISEFFKNVILPIIFTTATIIMLCTFTKHYILGAESFKNCIISCSIITLIQAVAIGIFGLSNTECKILTKYMKKRFLNR